MKKYIIFFLFVFSACNSKKQKPSNSYIQIESFLNTASINDIDKIYFYEGKPRMPLPNVHCFNGQGDPVIAPPQCFGILPDYIKLLEDSTLPEKANAETLDVFLKSFPIMDSYNQRVTKTKIEGNYDFYLFVDFMALPVPELKEILHDAIIKADNSRKKIKLLLVHALSEKNINSFSGKGLADTSGQQKSINPYIIQ